MRSISPGPIDEPGEECNVNNISAIDLPVIQSHRNLPLNDLKKERSVTSMVSEREHWRSNITARKEFAKAVERENIAISKRILNVKSEFQYNKFQVHNESQETMKNMIKKKWNPVLQPKFERENQPIAVIKESHDKLYKALELTFSRNME